MIAGHTLEIRVRQSQLLPPIPSLILLIGQIFSRIDASSLSVTYELISFSAWND